MEKTVFPQPRLDSTAKCKIADRDTLEKVWVKNKCSLARSGTPPYSSCLFWGREGRIQGYQSPRWTLFPMLFILALTGCRRHQLLFYGRVNPLRHAPSARPFQPKFINHEKIYRAFCSRRSHCFICLRLRHRNPWPKSAGRDYFSPRGSDCHGQRFSHRNHSDDRQPSP